jgi:hypothetical protein
MVMYHNTYEIQGWGPFLNFGRLLGTNFLGAVMNWNPRFAIVDLIPTIANIG